MLSPLTPPPGLSPVLPRPALAVVTLLGDEPELLPIWLAHYTAQVDAAHCYLFDPAGHAARLQHAGIAVIRLPPGLPDSDRRAEFIARFCTALLEWYDAVLHAEPDELIMADPARHADLAAYAAATTDAAVLALGHAVLHHPTEPGLDPTRPVLAQRRHVQFRAALCRPVLLRTRQPWPQPAPVAPAFGDLYLFHLRLADRQIGLARLARARAAGTAPGWWNTASDDAFLHTLQRLALHRLDTNMELTNASRVVWHTIAGLPLPPEQPGAPAEDRYAAYEIDQLWPLPERFGRTRV